MKKKIGPDCTRVSCPLVVYPPGTLLHLPTTQTLQPDYWQMYSGWGGKTQHAEESGLFFQLSFYPIQGTLKDLFDTVFVVVQLKHIIVCVWQGSQRQQSCLSAEQGICSGFCDPPSWTRVSWVCGCTADRRGWLPKCITRRWKHVSVHPRCSSKIHVIIAFTLRVIACKMCTNEGVYACSPLSLYGPTPARFTNHVCRKQPN